MSGIMKRACRKYGLKTNPVSGVERLREVKKLDLEVLEPEEVWALVRAAATEQDAAIYLTAAHRHAHGEIPGAALEGRRLPTLAHPDPSQLRHALAHNA